MGHILRFSGDPHQQVQTLLPWYLNGTLDEAEAAVVEAHLAECEECRDDLAMERAIGSEASTIPIDVDQGWAAMRARLEEREARPQPVTAEPEEAEPKDPTPATVVPLRRKPLLQRSIPMRWVLTAQAAAVVLVAGGTRLMTPAAVSEPLYHALGSAPQAKPGNMVVIFRPDTVESDLRGAMVASGAELVGGPTASDAYVLRVDARERDSALARLRSNRHVMLAEPIDGGGQL